MRYTKLLWLLAFLLPAVASASIIDLESSAGIWSPVSPDAATIDGFSGLGTSTIRWGIPFPDGQSAFQSAFSFTGAVQLGIGSGTPFVVGTFGHLNGVVGGTLLSGAQLDITANFQVPGDGLGGGGNITRNFSYLFAHAATENIEGQCPPGSASVCDDVVDVLNTIPPETFNVGSTPYTLQVLGFSKDGGATFPTQFLNPETVETPMELYLRITAIPEPGSLGLFTGGLLALCALARRRRR